MWKRYKNKKGTLDKLFLSPIPPFPSSHPFSIDIAPWFLHRNAAAPRTPGSQEPGMKPFFQGYFKFVSRIKYRNSKVPLFLNHLVFITMSDIRCSIFALAVSIAAMLFILLHYECVQPRSLSRRVEYRNLNCKLYILWTNNCDILFHLVYQYRVYFWSIIIIIS